MSEYDREKQCSHFRGAQCIYGVEASSRCRGTSYANPCPGFGKWVRRLWNPPSGTSRTEAPCGCPLASAQPNFRGSQARCHSTRTQSVAPAAAKRQLPQHQGKKSESVRMRRAGADRAQSVWIVAPAARRSQYRLEHQDARRMHVRRAIHMEASSTAVRVWRLLGHLLFAATSPRLPFVPADPSQNPACLTPCPCTRFVVWQAELERRAGDRIQGQRVALLPIVPALSDQGSTGDTLATAPGCRVRTTTGTSVTLAAVRSQRTMSTAASGFCKFTGLSPRG